MGSEALVHHVTLACSLLGFYISPDILNRLNFKDYGHALNQLQYYCSSATDAQKGKNVALEAGWRELAILNEPVVENRNPGAVNLIEPLGMQKLGLLFDLRSFLAYSESIEVFCTPRVNLICP